MKVPYAPERIKGRKTRFTDQKIMEERTAYVEKCRELGMTDGQIAEVLGVNYSSLSTFMVGQGRSRYVFNHRKRATEEKQRAKERLTDHLTRFKHCLTTSEVLNIMRECGYKGIEK